MRTILAVGLLLGSVGAEALTVDEVLASVGPAARARLQPYFAAARLSYPPRRATLVALKDERRLEVWGHAADGPRCVREYTILGASGVAGPKLRRGDMQVPEGVYRATWLNPNSAGYLGIKLDYPNAFDRRMARADGRRDLGGDIYAHGHWFSTGCLAMGNEPIEDLFVLAADTGVPRVRVVIAPSDLRSRPAPTLTRPWAAQLYTALRRELAPYR